MDYTFLIVSVRSLTTQLDTNNRSIDHLTDRGIEYRVVGICCYWLCRVDNVTVFRYRYRTVSGSQNTIHTFCDLILFRNTERIKRRYGMCVAKIVITIINGYIDHRLCAWAYLTDVMRNTNKKPSQNARSGKFLISNLIPRRRDW